jgi:hypothetical protein
VDQIIKWIFGFAHFLALRLANYSPATSTIDPDFQWGFQPDVADETAIIHDFLIVQPFPIDLVLLVERQGEIFNA